MADNQNKNQSNQFNNSQFNGTSGYNQTDFSTDDFPYQDNQNFDPYSSQPNPSFGGESQNSFDYPQPNQPNFDQNSSFGTNNSYDFPYQDNNQQQGFEDYQQVGIEGDSNATNFNQGQPNTFEEKKSGNRLFLIGSGIVVVILLIATGVLLWYNFGANRNQPSNSNSNQSAIVNDSQNQNSNNSDSTDDTEEDENDDVIVDNGSTGGDSTPATSARVNNASTLTKEWRLQKFTRPDIDAEGNCVNSSTCGDQADPDDDGAINLVEFNFDTDPLEGDTDRDQIADGDELFVYYTNPRNTRSDTDTFTDNVEIANCFDPISITTEKINSQRRNQISSNVALRPLHEPTIGFLEVSGATPSDIRDLGLISATCNPAPPATTPVTETPTSTETPQDTI